MAASATAFIELYNDITNGRLIIGPTASGWDGQSFKLAETKIYQGSKLPIRYYPIKPAGQYSYVYVSLDGLALDIALGPRAGAEAILARQNIWTPSDDGRYFEATLNLNTTEMNNAIAAADTFSTWFEINLSIAGAFRPTYQEQISLQSVVIGPSGAANLPTAAVEYLTAAQLRAEFVRFSGNRNGATIELPSPDGASFRLIGCNNNKTAQDEVS